MKLFTFVSFRSSVTLTLLFYALFSSAQSVNFPWHTGTYGGSNGNRTYSVATGGNTMSATIVNNQNTWDGVGCAVSPTGGTSCCGGNGLVLGANWNSTAGNITVTITFAIAVAAPVTFTVQDINSNYCDLVTNSQDCYFWDEVAVTATQHTGATITPTAGESGGQTKATSAPWVMIRAKPESGSISWCPTATAFNIGTAGQCVKTITIVYRNMTGESNPIYNGNPYPQYVYVSQVTAGTVTATAPTSITGTSSLCASTPTTLTANAGNATTQWFSGSCGGPSAGTGATTSVTPPIGTTTYYARNIVCETSSACVNLPVTVNTVTATASALPATFCSGGSTTLSVAGNASSYNWNNGAGAGTSVTVAPASTTSYTVTGTLAGCTNTSAVAVTVNPSPVVLASAPLVSVCAGSSSTLDASGAASYNWSSSLGTNPSVAVTPVTSTVYEVTGTAANGCSASAKVPVNVLPLPTCSASYSPVIVCNGDTMRLTSNAAVATTTIPENFEGATQMMTLINGAYNKWYHGTGTTCTGAKSMYIGTDASTYGYLNNSSGVARPAVNFAYVDVPLTGDVSANLSFVGEVGGKPTDNISVWVIPTTTTLVPGAALTAGGGNFLVGGPFNGAVGACYPVSLDLLPYSGATKRIVFQWQNDGDPAANSATNPSVKIDDIVITQTHSFSYSWASNPAGFTSIQQSPHVSAATEATTYTVTVTRSDGCSRTASVATSTCPPPLPIQLIEFNGFVRETDNYLYWSTASELNNDYFELQRSAEANTFQTIGIVDGAGNSNQVLNYSFEDMEPYMNSYYRLKQVDFDGTPSFSEIILLDRPVEMGANNFSISPIPAEESIHISMIATTAGKIPCQIFDVTGKKVLSLDLQAETGANVFTVGIHTLSRGIYYVRLGENTSIVKMMMK